MNIGGKVITHPDTLFGTNDMRSLPDIDRIDIYNYLITFKQTYDHKSLKAFKSLDGYQLYMAAYVENLTLCKNVGVENIIVLKFQVKPKQRKEDPLNKLPYYTGWIILDSNNPSIEGAYCACKGGADGACRHTVAALFEIAQYAEEKNNFSVTSGPCMWTKKARVNEDNPGEIGDLDISLPGSSAKVPPTPLMFSPCTADVIRPNIDDFYSAIRILHPDANMLLNRYKHKELHPSREII